MNRVGYSSKGKQLHTKKFTTKLVYIIYCKLKISNLARCDRPSFPHPMQHINVYAYRAFATRGVLYLCVA